VPPGCELHYVGKRGGQPSIKQQEINKLLVTLCQQVGAWVHAAGGSAVLWMGGGHTERGQTGRGWLLACFTRQQVRFT
jgi:siroheme synthase